MLIVGCQSCGEVKILAGTPDKDGVARMNWSCPRCGAGQVLQLEVASRARMNDLHGILGGLALSGGPAGEVAAEIRRARASELCGDARHLQGEARGHGERSRPRRNERV